MQPAATIVMMIGRWELFLSSIISLSIFSSSLPNASSILFSSIGLTSSTFLSSLISSFGLLLSSFKTSLRFLTSTGFTFCFWTAVSLAVGTISLTSVCCLSNSSFCFSKTGVVISSSFSICSFFLSSSLVFFLLELPPEDWESLDPTSVIVSWYAQVVHVWVLVPSSVYVASLFETNAPYVWFSSFIFLSHPSTLHSFQCLLPFDF